MYVRLSVTPGPRESATVGLRTDVGLWGRWDAEAGRWDLPPTSGDLILARGLGDVRVTLALEGTA